MRIDLFYIFQKKTTTSIDGNKLMSADDLNRALLAVATEGSPCCLRKLMERS